MRNRVLPCFLSCYYMYFCHVINKILNMLAVQTFPQIEKNMHNCKIKKLSTEEFIIKNVIGEYKEIPQVIYLMIQDCLSKGEEVNAILKWQTKDSCYWLKTLFTPASLSDFKQNIKIETAFISIQEINRVQKLYNTLISIEEKLGLEYSKKYLDGFLEEKGIYFNELPSHLNKQIYMN